MKKLTNEEWYKKYHEEQEEMLVRLTEAFPILWRDSAIKNPGPYSVDFGVGAGWHQLVWDCSEQLEREIKSVQQLYPIEILPKVVQVKEKFGSMRFYVDNFCEPISTEMNLIIDNAEHGSAKFCEYCGNPGQLRTTWPKSDRAFGWIKTLCDDCWIFEARRRSDSGLNAPNEFIEWLKANKEKAL